MVNNIFRIFDTSTRTYLALNWLRAFLILLILPYNFWVKQSRYRISWPLLFNSLIMELKSLSNFTYSNIIILISLFIFLLLRNFIGLAPYVFTISRHIRFCLSLSLSIWFGIILFRITNYFNDLCGHLTPHGTPLLLMPFIVLVESIRLIIRPFTLAIRLTANIIAGHLLLSLLGSSGESIFLTLIPFLILPQTLLLILEFAVSFIQAYVFTILRALYSRES